MCELFDFFDAARLAVELTEHGEHRDAVVLFRGCTPERVEVMPPDSADTFAMIDRVLRHAETTPTAFWTLFISAGATVGEELAEVDLAKFRMARRRLARAGLDLLDWMHTDGELVRSMSYAADPSRAWTTDDAATRGEALHLLARHALAWSWGCGAPLDGLRTLGSDSVDLDPEDFDDAA